MADFNLDAAAALRAKIYHTLTNGSPTANSFLSYCTTGIILTPEMLKFLDGEDVYSAEVFAQQANGIPAGIGDWVAGSGRIWSVYKNWINEYDYPPYNPSEDDRQRLEAAIATVDENIDTYLTYRGAYQEAQLTVDLLNLTPKNMRDKDWQKEFATAKIERDKAKTLWESKGKRDIVETAQANMLTYGRKDPGRIRKYLTDLLGEEVSIGNAGFYPTSVFPANFYKPEVSWPKFKMSSTDIDQYKNDRNVNFGGQASVDAAAFKIDLDGEGNIIYKEEQLDTDSIEIEFEMTRVTIQRPWFDPFLMFSRSWKWPTQTRDDPDTSHLISDGKVPPLNATMGMVPTEIIVARNIRVKLKKESTNNQQFLLDVKGGASVGITPFQISGNITWKEQEIKLKTTVTEDSITCENMQIIGFFCQLVPQCPNPDWKLWPKEATIADTAQ